MKKLLEIKQQAEEDEEFYFGGSPKHYSQARTILRLCAALEKAVEQRNDFIRAQGDDVHWSADIDDNDTELLAILEVKP
jgi:hypothetical protein